MKSLYFTEDHQIFRQSVRQFMQKEVLPNIEQWEEDKKLPREIWRKMGEMGYLGIGFPEAYGGMNADFFFDVIFLEELARSGSGGFSAAFSVHEYMAIAHINEAGSEELKQKYLVPALKGDKIGALAISEPDAGSDVGNLRTTATKKGDFYYINGSKTFITNGVYSDFITLAVRTGGNGFGGLSLIIVDGNSEGLTRTPLKKLGWHCSDTGELAFDNVKVPVENLVGEEGKGFYYLMDSFRLERLVAAVMSVAGSELAVEVTLQYMAERSTFGRSINKYQVLRHRFADLATEIEAAKQFTYHTCWLYSQGEMAVKQCSMVKLLTSELAKKVADVCLQSFGGYGFMEEYPMARMFRDTRAGTIVGGSSEIMREIIAKMVIDDVQYNSAYQEAGENNNQAEEPDAKAIIQSIPSRFRPEKAAGINTIFHFDIAGDNGGQFTVIIKDENCELEEGLQHTPNCILTAKDEIYRDVELGKKSPESAFMNGEIQVSDIAEMMKFTRLFKRVK